jgi:hypothetical protein
MRVGLLVYKVITKIKGSIIFNTKGTILSDMYSS